jgi:hypothetical protein
VEDFQDLELQELIQSGFTHLVEVVEEQETIPEQVDPVDLVAAADRVDLDQHQTEEMLEQQYHPPTR